MERVLSSVMILAQIYYIKWEHITWTRQDGRVGPRRQVKVHLNTQLHSFLIIVRWRGFESHSCHFFFAPLAYEALQTESIKRLIWLILLVQLPIPLSSCFFFDKSSPLSFRIMLISMISDIILISCACDPTYIHLNILISWDSTHIRSTNNLAAHASFYAESRLPILKV